MAKRFKDFGSTFNGVSNEAVTFTLHGEEFECHSNMQGKVLLNIVANSNEDDPQSVANTMTEFFEKALLPESYERFSALLEAPDTIVPVDTLGEITGWLVEQYSARPTEEPKGS